MSIIYRGRNGVTVTRYFLFLLALALLAITGLAISIRAINLALAEPCELNDLVKREALCGEVGESIRVHASSTSG